MTNQQDQENLTDWRIFDKNVDLYKFYVDLVIKSGIFVFGVTGALFSFTVTAILDKGVFATIFSLLIPLAMNAGFCFIVHNGIKPAEYLKNHNEELSEKLGLPIVYEFETLIKLLKLFRILYALILVGLIAFIGYFATRC